MHKCRIRPLGLMAALLGLAAVFTACNQTKIADIQKHPESYAGEEVTIAGKVIHSGGDFASGSFELDDESGKLWIISKGFDLPTEGSKIAVTGMVVDKSDLAPTTLLTVLQEIRRYEGGD